MRVDISKRNGVEEVQKYTDRIQSLVQCRGFNNHMNEKYSYITAWFPHIVLKKALCTHWSTDHYVSYYYFLLCHERIQYEEAKSILLKMFTSFTILSGLLIQ